MKELLQQALMGDYPQLVAAVRKYLAAPMPEPVAWYRPSPDGDDSIFRDHRTVIACTGNKWEGFVPLYAAPPAAPAPAVPDWMHRMDEILSNAIVSRTDAEIVDAARLVFIEGWESKSAAPVVREPIIDEMDAVASRYAHKLALDLECVLSDYNGKWWDTAMQTIGEYRMAMNRIHERESPTHMGEPVLPKISSGVGK